MPFKWTVNKLTIDEDSLVVKVDLTVTGTEDDVSASVAFTRNLVRGDAFIPYEQLTEKQVLDWCFKPIVCINMGNVNETFIRLIKNECETQVTREIENQLAQKFFEPALPWQLQESVA